MTDTETGEEYSFVLADDFVYQDEHYCVLITADEDEEEPEMVITRVVTMDDGTEGLMSLDDDEYDRVYANTSASVRKMKRMKKRTTRKKAEPGVSSGMTGRRRSMCWLFSLTSIMDMNTTCPLSMLFSYRARICHYVPYEPDDGRHANPELTILRSMRHEAASSITCRSRTEKS
jgi:hypothetical protein